MTHKLPTEASFSRLREKVPKADEGALGAIFPIRANALTSFAAESHALRVRSNKARTFPPLAGEVPKADEGALGAIFPIRANALTSFAAESHALRVRSNKARTLPPLAGEGAEGG